MNYKRESRKTFTQALQDLQNKVVENGFRVLHIHNVKQTLEEKGFKIDEYCIVEICNAKFANTVININKDYGVMMPCKIIIYVENGKTFILTQEPELIVAKFGMDEVKDIAREVGTIMKKIIDESI
ncbi:MAG: DUF302 domain-containing protein [Ignavibacteria bacterium]|nr:DUF302 domain-containing protein [Ignavibacteria bacterium]